MAEVLRVAWLVVVVWSRSSSIAYDHKRTARIVCFKSCFDSFRVTQVSSQLEAIAISFAGATVFVDADNRKRLVAVDFVFSVLV